jgi:hypothetical protein
LVMSSTIPMELCSGPATRAWRQFWTSACDRRLHQVEFHTMKLSFVQLALQWCRESWIGRTPAKHENPAKNFFQR